MTSRWDDEAGFTLVEVMVASFVLLIGMVSVLGVVTQSVVHSRATRTTDLATQIGNQEIESYRSFAYDSIGIDKDDTTYTNTPADVDGNPVLKIDDCDPTPGVLVTCPLHEEQVTRGGQTFTVTRTVVAVDDPMDNDASGDPDPKTTVAGGVELVIDYKRVIVNVAWAGQRPGSQRIETNIRADALTAPKVVRGVRFEVMKPDPPDGDGTYIAENDASINFPVEVRGVNSYTGESIEGVADLLGIPPGAYQCIVYAASPEWHPADDLLGDRDTQPCTFNNNVMTVTSHWVRQACQSTFDPTHVAVTVRDADGVLIQGATVELLDSENNVVTGTTDANGVAEFDETYGPYTIKATYHDASGTYQDLGPADTRRCLNEANTAVQLDFLGTLQPVAAGPTEAPTASACPTTADKVVLCVYVTNISPDDRYLRLEVEPDKGSTWYVPAKTATTQDDKEYPGELFLGDERRLLAVVFDAADAENMKIKKVKVQYRETKTKGNGTVEYKWKDDTQIDKGHPGTLATWPEPFEIGQSYSTEVEAN